MRLALPLLLTLLLIAGCGHDTGSSEAGSTDSGSTAGTSTATPEPHLKPISLKAQTGRVIVVMYHDVIEQRDKTSEWFDCTGDELEEQFKYIKEHDGTVITMQELYDHLVNGTPVAPRAVVLTFDDNYQGVYDFAYPLLKKYNFPATVFVHTGFVGNKTQGRPKMTWETLKELVDSKLVTVEAHTITHPGDITTLSESEQKKELEDSKKALEDHLHIPVSYMAYPTGKNDATTRDLADKAGYLMSFTMQGVPAEQSPSILQVGRYVQTQFQKAWDAREDELASEAPAYVSITMNSPEVTCETGKFSNLNFAIIKGGTPVSILADGRQSVSDFVAQAGPDAVAGVNGTFFSMAAINTQDNQMVGPFLASNGKPFMKDTEDSRLPKLKDRPVVMWDGKTMTFVPFAPDLMNDEAIFRAAMPNVTDLFLAGAWIVHDGKPKTQDQMQPFASKDIMDFRRRVFFGLQKDGSVITGASLGSITTEQLAAAAAEAGAVEAVLLDSGFSTSLVYDGKILASGHSEKDMPSRPVPHAIVLKGTKGTTVVPDINPAGEDKPGRGKRRRHSRKH